MKIGQGVAQLRSFGLQGIADVGENKIRDSHGGSSAPPPDGLRVVRGGNYLVVRKRRLSASLFMIELSRTPSTAQPQEAAMRIVSPPMPCALRQCSAMSCAAERAPRRTLEGARAPCPLGGRGLAGARMSKP